MSETSSGLQYLRKASLVVGSASGARLDVSSLRFTFSIQHGTIQTPRAAAIRIYNVSQQTIAKVQQEFRQVVLHAGYQSNAAIVLNGTIRQFRAGRENPTDTFLDIFAVDGDQAYNQAVVNVSLTKGWTDNDILAACLKAMAPYGVSKGLIAPLNNNAAVRGCTLYGSVKGILRDLAARNGCSWNLDQNKLNFIAIGQPLTGAQAIVLRPDTGLIGIPRQTIDGVEFTALLNPQIRPGSLVQIAKADVLGAPPDLSYGSTQQSLLPAIAAAGVYVVQWVELEGDTRGEAWYTHGVCTSYDPSEQPSTSSAVRENTDS